VVVLEERVEAPVEQDSIARARGDSRAVHLLKMENRAFCSFALFFSFSLFFCFSVRFVWVFFCFFLSVGSLRTENIAKRSKIPKGTLYLKCYF
jgi:hypothetical protein